jgi:hypothetical protein
MRTLNCRNLESSRDGTKHVAGESNDLGSGALPKLNLVSWTHQSSVLGRTRLWTDFSNFVASNHLLKQTSRRYLPLVLLTSTVLEWQWMGWSHVPKNSTRNKFSYATRGLSCIVEHFLQSQGQLGNRKTRISYGRSIVMNYMTPYKSGKTRVFCSTTWKVFVLAYA